MTRRTVEIIAFCIAILIAALAFHAWLTSHDDHLRLESTLATQKQILDAADARERDRNAALKDTLAQIDALKRQSQSPEEILRELPKYIQLPQPITLAPQISAPISAGRTNEAPRAEDKSAQRYASPASSPNASAASGTSTNENQQGTRAPAKQGTSGSAKNGTAASAKSFWRSLLHPGEKEANARSLDGLPAPPTQPGQSASNAAISKSPSDGNANEPGAESKSRAVESEYLSPASASTISGNQSASRSPYPSAQNRTSISPRATASATESAPDQSAASTDAAAISPRRNTSTPEPAPNQSTSSPTASATAQIPAADLKPLYNFVQDCRACQLQLVAAKQNTADDTLKITALTRERNAALASAKGGSFWLRLRRNAYWLAIGAAAAAGTLCASGHCR